MKLVEMVAVILLNCYNESSKGHILLLSQITPKILETFTVFSRLK